MYWFTNSVKREFVSLFSGACTTVVPPPCAALAIALEAPGATTKSSFGESSNKPPSLVDIRVLPSAAESTSPAFENAL